MANGYPNTSRYPDPGNEARKARERDYRLSRLERAMTNLPKTPTPAAGGSIIGVAEVDTVTASVLHDSSGLDRYSITYDAPWDYGIAGLKPASSFCTVSANELHLAAGTYSIAVRVDYGWASGAAGSAPDYVQIAVVNRGSSAEGIHGGYDSTFPCITNGAGAKGVSVWTPPAPAFVSDGDWFWVELSVTSQPSAGSAVTGINGDPGLHWTIWKYV